MVDQMKINKALAAVTGQNTVETGKIVAKSLAFDAQMSKITEEVIEHGLALVMMHENIYDKIRYINFVLDTAKDKPEMFLETCNLVAKTIGELPDYKAKVVYSILESMGQKEFTTIVNAAAVATKTVKKTTRKYVKKDKAPKIDTGDRGDYNVWVYPESRSIFKYMYSPISRTLHVIFISGSQEYTYYDISPEMFRELQDSDSKGRYFAKNIKIQHSANYK